MKSCENIDPCKDYEGESSILIANVLSRSIPNKSQIQYKTVYVRGEEICAVTNMIFSLERDHLYLINHNIKANLKVPEFIHITPRINGRAQENFIFKSVNSCASREASDSCTFLVNTKGRRVYLDFLFDSCSANSDVSGILSIVKIK